MTLSRRRQRRGRGIAVWGATLALPLLVRGAAEANGVPTSQAPRQPSALEFLSGLNPVALVLLVLLIVVVILVVIRLVAWARR